MHHGCIQLASRHVMFVLQATSSSAPEISLFEAVQGTGLAEFKLLSTQYRMPEEISMFPNMAFYGGKLENCWSYSQTVEKSTMPVNSLTSCSFSREEKNGTSWRNAAGTHHRLMLWIMIVDHK